MEILYKKYRIIKVEGSLTRDTLYYVEQRKRFLLFAPYWKRLEKYYREGLFPQEFISYECALKFVKRLVHQSEPNKTTIL